MDIIKKIINAKVISTRKFKPLDFVKTPKGSFAMVTEINGNNCSIRFIGPSNGEKNAWWSPLDGLEYLENLPRLIAVSCCHPFGNGRKDAENSFK